MPSNYSAKEIRRIEAKRRKRFRRWLRSLQPNINAQAAMRRLGIDPAYGIDYQAGAALDSRGRVLWRLK